jgi:hypothetical protein
MKRRDTVAIAAVLLVVATFTTGYEIIVSHHHPPPGVERMVGEGDLVAMQWRTTVRYSDPTMPDLDGRSVSFPSMTFIRFEGGKIVQMWNIQDTSTMQTQLHALTEPAGSR